MIPEHVQKWLDSLPREMPLQAIPKPACSSELSQLIATNKLDSSSITAALLWLRIGEIERPHLVVQDDRTDMGSYLHGVVHRLEGDFFNAGYWLRQLRNNTLMNSIAMSIDEQATELSAPIHATWHQELLSPFQPRQFFSACENLVGQRKPLETDQKFLGWLGYAEWQALWILHQDATSKNSC
jgi:hypothetical protein